jgi:hypothetical protein
MAKFLDTIDGGGLRAVNFGDPGSPGDLATKSYVDLHAPSDGSVPLYVQQAAPTPPGGTYLWVQTYPNGDLQIWIEDGT